MYLVYFAWSEKNSMKTKTVKLDVERTIGRDASCDVVVNDRQVSGTQARVYDQGGTVMIKNVSSTNDILVGGAVVAKNGGTAMLVNGATLEMGKTSFTSQTGTVAEGTTSFKNCTWCSKSIPATDSKCIWCGRDQGAGTDATFTMA